MKTCCKCKEIKPLNCFGKLSTSKDGKRHDCKTCANAAALVWKQANCKKRIAANQKWYINNKEKSMVKAKKWRENNRLAVNARSLQWAKNNSEKINAKIAKRRANKLQATPVWAELDLIKTVYVKAKQYGFEVDHVIPLQGKNVCGLHVWANLQLLDRSINSSKGNKYYE